MTENQSYKDRWQNAQPSKTMLFWSCAGCVVLTAIVGFTWGGWVTGGTAQDMALNSADEARAELAAAICVESFLGAPDVEARLASLGEASSWARDGLIEDGGWVTLAGMDSPIDDAADRCADLLMEVELPAVETEAAQTQTVPG